jgi:hypothetical protein
MTVSKQLFEKGEVKHLLKWPINLGTILKPKYDYPHFELKLNS